MWSAARGMRRSYERPEQRPVLGAHLGRRDRAEGRQRLHRRQVHVAREHEAGDGAEAETDEDPHEEAAQHSASHGRQGSAALRAPQPEAENGHEAEVTRAKGSGSFRALVPCASCLLSPGAC